MLTTNLIGGGCQMESEILTVVALYDKQIVFCK